MLIELFSLDVTAEALRANIGPKSSISLQRGPVDPKFQVEGVAPTNHSSSQKSRLNGLSYGIKIWTDLSSVLSQCTRLTDGWTDNFLIAIPRLHPMQRGNKIMIKMLNCKRESLTNGEKQSESSWCAEMVTDCAKRPDHRLRMRVDPVQCTYMYVVHKSTPSAETVGSDAQKAKRSVTYGAHR